MHYRISYGGYRGGASKQMRRLAILLLTIPLAGCFTDQKQAVAKCEMDTFRVYPDQRTRYTIAAENYLELCMTAAGYDFDISSAKCQPQMGGAFVSADQPSCYVPSNPGGKLGYQIEMWLEAHDL